MKTIVNLFLITFLLTASGCTPTRIRSIPLPNSFVDLSPSVNLEGVERVVKSDEPRPVSEESRCLVLFTLRDSCPPCVVFKRDVLDPSRIPCKPISANVAGETSSCWIVDGISDKEYRIWFEKNFSTSIGGYPTLYLVSNGKPSKSWDGLVLSKFKPTDLHKILKEGGDSVGNTQISSMSGNSIFVPAPPVSYSYSASTPVDLAWVPREIDTRITFNADHGPMMIPVGDGGTLSFKSYHGVSAKSGNKVKTEFKEKVWYTKKGWLTSVNISGVDIDGDKNTKTFHTFWMDVVSPLMWIRP